MRNLYTFFIIIISFLGYKYQLMDNNLLIVSWIYIEGTKKFFFFENSKKKNWFSKVNKKTF